MVLMVLAIIAGAAMLNLSGPVSQAKLGDILDEVAAFDGLMRSYAIAYHKRCLLQIDLENNVLTRKVSGDESLDLSRSFSDRYKIIAVYTAKGRFDKSIVSLACNELGLSHSYAVGFEDSDGHAMWLFVAGLTGQIRVYEKEGNVQAIFETWHARTRAD